MSGILNKMMTALRGGATEVGEAVVDANAIRIYRQELVDARDHLTKAKQSLTEVMAEEMRTGREVQRLEKAIAEHEGYAVAALDKGDEALATEVAERIAELEQELASQREARDNFATQSRNLKTQIQSIERTIHAHERELSIVQTTDSVQKATRSIGNHFGHGNSRLYSARESLDRIKQRQQRDHDRMQAAKELEESGPGAQLEEKLRQAGIAKSQSDANDVLARLRKKKQD